MEAEAALSRDAIWISSEVAIPLDAVTQTFAVLGKRGSGKTNTASVLAEKLIKHDLPVVYVDPIGVVWGLRHSSDGKSPGLPVIILGGEHADVPLEETGGAVIADFVIEHRRPVVLDLGLFSKGAQRRFMVDFAERLYHKNRDALHVMLDECDTFCPQRIDHGGERLVGAINDLVRKGRARGLGVTLISQRPALISKDVLTQVEVLVAHRMTGPQDRDAIARWIEYNADQDGQEVLASLQQLKDGEAWVWSPSWMKRLTRTRVHLRETFDSSATPKAGERVAIPKRAAEVDLAALRDRLSATIEKAKADDPRELRRRIAELEKQVKVTPTAAKTVEVPVLTTEQEKRLLGIRDEVTGLRYAVSKLDQKFEVLGGLYADHRRDVMEMAARVSEMLDQIPRGRLFPAPLLNVAAPKPTKPSAPTPPATRTAPPAAGPGESMKLPLRKILLALAQHGPCSKAKLAILTHYASGGGGFNNYLGALRTAGWVGAGDPIAPTVAGLTALGHFEPLDDDPVARLDAWMQHQELGRAHREILRVLREQGPTVKEGIAELARSEKDEPYDPNGGGFNNALGKLRTLGLIGGGRGGSICLADGLQ